MIYEMKFDLPDVQMEISIDEFGTGTMSCVLSYTICIVDWKFEFGEKQYQICYDDSVISRVWQLMEVRLSVVAVCRTKDRT